MSTFIFILAVVAGFFAALKVSEEVRQAPLWEQIVVCSLAAFVVTFLVEVVLTAVLR